MHVHSKDETRNVAVDCKIIIKMEQKYLFCDTNVNCLMKGRDKPLWHQEVEASGISRHSAHGCGKVVSHSYRPFHPPPFPRDVAGTRFC